jgi:methylenetetrahydrofolate reductase (NADPH)
VERAPTLSFEFFPPKDDAGQATLLATLEQIGHLGPAFVSVTYGAGGSTQDRTLRTCSLVRQQLQVPTVGHLTLVGATRAQLADTLTQYQRLGLHGVLALRGDPVGGPTAPWTATPGGLQYAEELVEMASGTALEVGVAAFPDVHPASNGNFLQDIQVLLRKEDKGASFAITQFVFDSGRFEALRNALDQRGSRLRLYAGIMPVTNYGQILRMLELSGGYMPTTTRLRFARYQNDPQALRELGVEIATAICHDVIALGADGLHFYTLNQSEPAVQVISRLGLV